MTVQEALQNIKNAILGRDVRQSIHDGIKAIDEESKADMEAKQAAIDEYTKRQDGVISDYTGRMDILNSKYEEQIKNMTLESPSDVEIVDARRTSGNIVCSTLKERLDTEFSEKANIIDPVFSGSFSMGRNLESEIGEHSHAEGYKTTASGRYSYAEGSETTAMDYASHAEGDRTTASGRYSHAEGSETTASGYASHAEGVLTKASGSKSHAEGSGTTANGIESHAEGNGTKANGDCSHAEGWTSAANGDCSHAGGYGTIANDHQFTIGRWNDEVIGPSSTEDGITNKTIFIIGNGRYIQRSNCIRITDAGTIYSASGSVISGADYAEFFEWKDGNKNGEDRVGYFVTFDTENMIKKASENDYILGITSGNPCIIGNGDECWTRKRIMDDFNRFVYEDVEYTDEKTGEKRKTKFYKINPDYDETLEYTQRIDRKEWAAVGMLGVIPVRDDGTSEVNGYCKVKDGGIATKCDTYGVNSYRVISRVSENVVNVVFR